LEQETDTVVGQDGDIKDQIQTIKDLEAQLQSQEEEFAALQGSTQPTDAPESEPE
jgi:hypothetical protein